MMQPVLTALVVFMFVSASQADPIPPQSGYTPEQRQVIVDLHNEYRAMEPASDMPDVTYDLALEAQAQVQADKCVFEHSDIPNLPITAGENLALVGSWATEVDDIVGDPVTRWWSEKPNYDYATGACAEGSCGHYRVIIKANVNRVGCGVAFCADGIAGWTNSNTGVAIPGWTVYCQYAPYVSSGLYPYTCVGDTCPPPPTTEAPVPITVVDPNAYCREVQGADSFMITKTSIEGDVCDNMACSISYPSSSYMNKHSPNGLPCGVGQVCIDGSCDIATRDIDPTEETFSLPANCLYGDQQFYRTGGVQYTCAEWIALKGERVCGDHWSNAAITCCASCMALLTAPAPTEPAPTEPAPTEPDGCVDQDNLIYYEEDYTCAALLGKKGSRYCAAGHWFDMANKCCATCSKLDMTGECLHGDMAMVVRGTSSHTCPALLEWKGARYCSSSHYFEMPKKCCATCQEVDMSIDCSNGEPDTVTKSGEQISCADLLALKGVRYCERAHYFNMAEKCCETCAPYTITN